MVFSIWNNKMVFFAGKNGEEQQETEQRLQSGGRQEFKNEVQSQSS